MTKEKAKKIQSIGEIYDGLQKSVDEMAEDITKFQNGNKSSGRRLRKALQELKKQIKPWRDDIQATIVKM